MNSDRRAVGDVVDRLQIRHAIQGDIRLRAEAAIGNVAQTVLEGQCFLRQIEFENVIEYPVRRIERYRQRGPGCRAFRTEDRVESLSDPVAHKC
jgi:hypothetical protein